MVVDSVFSHHGRDCAAESFADMFPMIKRIVRAFCRRYRRDVAETISEASFLFLRIHQQYRPNRYPDYEKYVRVKLWYRLQDSIVRDTGSKRKKHNRQLDMDICDGQLPQVNTEFNGRLQTTSKDARFVVGILGTFSNRNVSRWARSGLHFRAALESTLSEFGWAATRITESLDELRAIL